MTAMPRLTSTTVALAMLLIVHLVAETAASGHAGADASGNGRSAPETAPHIRVEDQRLNDLIEFGRRRSALLQRLIDALEQSDVVVYVRCDQRLRRGVAGNLSFVSMSAGTRYVLVRVGYVGDRLRQIALIGHEMRHAVEVADTPDIVDRPSFDRAYARLGYINRDASTAGVIAFESDAAVDAGEQIFRELRNATE